LSYLSLRPFALAVITAAAVLQSGCSVISPAPSLELLKAAGTAAAYAVSTGPSSASNTVFHERLAIDTVCIEFNRQAQFADLVPAIQQELRTHRIDSRVYEDGTSPQICPVWLRYRAFMEYAKPPFSDVDKPYLKNASLALINREGRVLSTSDYQATGFMEMGKWSPTRSKLAPVVTALITGFEK
jgi:hypothetical protein